MLKNIKCFLISKIFSKKKEELLKQFEQKFLIKKNSHTFFYITLYKKHN